MSVRSRELISVRVAAIALAAALTLSGCGAADDDAALPGAEQSDADGSTEAAAIPSRLAGTRWQLVEFQSMDDAIGTTRPDDPSVYTMELIGDGRVAMQLNCNRATGTWSAEAGADGASGTFDFGVLAMTRALCSPPSLDQQIARDAEYVTGFLLRDGRLSLSLMADAGIYVWELAE